MCRSSLDAERVLGQAADMLHHRIEQPESRVLDHVNGVNQREGGKISTLCG
jgi:hypothetical protein